MKIKIQISTQQLELLDSRLMKQLAIRLSCQTTTAKSLVMRGNGGAV